VRIALLALTCCVFLTEYFLMPEVHGAPARLLRSKETDDEKADSMFPDGNSHNFGRVQTGTLAKHAFRIVNTSDAPLQITYVSVSMGAVRAQATKMVLQPGEEGRLETVLDTARFTGCRTIAVFVSMKNGNRTGTQVRFWVQADSQE
jgi:hypothetical protein